MMSAAHQDVIAIKAKLFRGLGDPSRLTILESLKDGPLTVTEIVQRTGLSQPNVSNHIACLKGCGLVTARRKGRFVEYSQNGLLISGILDLAGILLREVGEHVYACTRCPAVNGEDTKRAEEGVQL